MADEVASIFGEKSMLEPMSFESKACWRKEIKFLLSEKIFFSRNCVILIMLISSDFFFPLMICSIMVTQLRIDILDQSGVSAHCCIVYYYFCYAEGATLLFEISLSPKYFSYGFIFQQVI